MKIKIYVRLDDLAELDAFIKSAVPYEHKILYFKYAKEFRTPMIEVHVPYDVFVALEDFKWKDEKAD